VPILISSQLAHHLGRVARPHSSRGHVLRHDGPGAHHGALAQRDAAVAVLLGNGPTDDRPARAPRAAVLRERGTDEGPRLSPDG